jgi:integrase
MTAKRGNGEGSIYPNAKGVWTGVVSMPGGRRKYMYGGTREEVRRKLALALGAQASGDFADARGRTVGVFLDQWLAEVAKPSVRHWTFKGYEVHIRLHLKPALGRLPLDRLEPAHVQRLLNEKLRSGLSPKSVRYIRGTLRTALNHAVRWGYISRNPAALVDGPRVEPYEAKPFSVSEARQFLQAIRGDRLQALYSVALTMGLRQGEALGLRWQDVDLELGTLQGPSSCRGSMVSSNWLTRRPNGAGERLPCRRSRFVSCVTTTIVSNSNGSKGAQVGILATFY